MPRQSKAPEEVVKIIKAIDAGDGAELSRLLAAGAKPTPNGSTLSPLHAAITHFSGGKLGCDAGSLKLLLAHGADPDFIDPSSGFVPLEDALQIGNLNCANVLKSAGASVSKRGSSGQSLLQFAVKGAVHVGDPGIVRQVLAWGIDPNVRSTEHGFTALHEAVWATPGQPAEPVIVELLRGGTDPCIVNGNGQTALDVAVNISRSASIQRVLKEAMVACTQHTHAS